MGSLVTEIPNSEVTATLELLDHLGVSREDLTRFRKSSSRTRTEVAKLLREGKGEHVIDCDADPYIPKNCTVEEHQKGGELIFDTSQLALYLDEEQGTYGGIEGDKLRQRLIGKPVLNANLLDHLLKNPYLIPEDWKADSAGNARRIFFWGTVYRDSAGDLQVRFLLWDEPLNKWYWDFSRTYGRAWRENHPAAVRVQ